MAENLRHRLTTEISSATDYSRPYIHREFEETLTPDEVRYQFVETDTGGTTYTITNFASINSLAIRNTDSTNFVTLSYDSAGSTSNSVKLTAGQFFFTQDVDRATNLTLTADTAAVICEVIITGS